MQSLGWVWLEAACFGSGSIRTRGASLGLGPLVFFRRCLLPMEQLDLGLAMEQLDLGLQAGLFQTRRVTVWVWVARSLQFSSGCLKKARGPGPVEGPTKKNDLEDTAVRPKVWGTWYLIPRAT